MERFDGNQTQIKVGEKMFNFAQGDEIFNLSQPTKDCLKARGLKIKDIDLKGKPCNVCKKEIEPKKAQQCEFCAHFGCGECVYKQFPFPIENSDGSRAYGLICLVCETKLYISKFT